VAEDHGPSVKDDEQYERLRQKGESKEKAARIANTSRSGAGKRGGKSGSYEDWSKQELQERAREIGIEGRSNMNKGELIQALRNHLYRLEALGYRQVRQRARSRRPMVPACATHGARAVPTGVATSCHLVVKSFSKLLT
jgi:Rho termination factor, N-terminal domain